jgi:hypothetical protein
MEEENQYKVGQIKGGAWQAKRPVTSQTAPAKFTPHSTSASSPPPTPHPPADVSPQTGSAGHLVAGAKRAPCPPTRAARRCSGGGVRRRKGEAAWVRFRVVGHHLAEGAGSMCCRNVIRGNV